MNVTRLGDTISNNYGLQPSIEIYLATIAERSYVRLVESVVTLWEFGLTLLLYER